ncbi:MAG: TIGR02710 family CRISPR-associated CARF protein [Moorellales bacterium]
MMVVTVGVGRGIERAIVISIREANPERVVFVVTGESRNTLVRVRNVAEQMGVTLPPYDEVELKDENEAGMAYAAAVEAIHKLGEHNLDPTEVTVDYTTGSKPMSAGALYAAVTENCRTIAYVTGDRDENGRVISGTERVFTAEPNRLFARRVRSEAVRLFNSWQFGAAEQLLAEFMNRFSPELKRSWLVDLNDLHLLSCAYRAWDAFDHLAAKEAFDRIDRELIGRWADQIGLNKGWVNRLAGKLKEKEPAHRLCPELLVDLWANAERRLQERRFVDAVARYYRLTELIAQYRLWHGYGIITADVDLSRVPEKARPDYERYRNPKGRIQLPLQAAYSLLTDLGDELGNLGQDERLRNALSARNNSISGHGMDPVTLEVACQLREAVSPLLELVVPGLHNQLAQAAFPALGG